MKIELKIDEVTLIIALLQRSAGEKADEGKMESCRVREELAYKLVRAHELEAQ